MRLEIKGCVINRRNLNNISFKQSNTKSNLRDIFKILFPPTYLLGTPCISIYQTLELTKCIYLFLSLWMDTKFCWIKSDLSDLTFIILCSKKDTMHMTNLVLSRTGWREEGWPRFCWRLEDVSTGCREAEEVNGGCREVNGGWREVNGCWREVSGCCRDEEEPVYGFDFIWDINNFQFYH